MQNITIKVWLIGGLSIWLSGSWLAPAQAQFCATALPGVNRLNQAQSGDVIVIGRSPAHPYIVAVLSTDDLIVAAVRRCIPDAFITNSRLGFYLQAGMFTEYDRAASVSALLRSQGFDARVIYFR